MDVFLSVGPYVALALGIALAGYIVYLKFTRPNEELPGWIKGLTAAFFAVSAVLFAGRNLSKEDTDKGDPLPTPPSPDDKPTFEEEAKRNLEATKTRSEEAGKHVREEATNDEVAAVGAELFDPGAGDDDA